MTTAKRMLIFHFFYHFQNKQYQHTILLGRFFRDPGHRKSQSLLSWTSKG